MLPVFVNLFAAVQYVSCIPPDSNLCQRKFPSIQIDGIDEKQTNLLIDDFTASTPRSGVVFACMRMEASAS